MFLSVRISLLLILFPLFLTSQSIQWCDTIHYGGLNTIAGIGKDSLGNLYIGGSFEPTYHGEGTSGTFMSKYDASGNLLWSDTSKINETYGAAVSGVVIDKTGNAYFAGVTWANIKFGNFLFQPAGYTNFFLVKYDPAGTVIWVKQITGAGGVLSLAINTQDMIYLAGQCNNATIDTFNVPGPGFIAKFNTAGDCLSAISSSDIFVSMVATTSGDILVDESDNALYPTHYLKKMDAGLNTIWSLKFPGTDKLRSDKAGNCYYKYDAGIIKLNPLGVPQWTFTADPDDSLGYFGIGCDANTLYLTGYIGRYSTNSSHILFVDHLDPAGTLITRTKYLNNVVGTDLLIDGNDLYITGNTLSYGNSAFIMKAGSGFASVTDVRDEVFYSVYPNPSAGVFNVCCRKKDKFSLRIFNAFGQLIHNEDYFFKTSIDLNRQSKGIYYLEIVQGGQKMTRKLLLE